MISQHWLIMFIWTGCFRACWSHFSPTRQTWNSPSNFHWPLKSFDTIDHDILLNKLNYYGIQSTTLQLFKSYLTNQQQFVQYKEESSTLNQITTGVLQGSILGLLLFIIYMNDIRRVSNKFHCILYANDTTITERLCTFNVPVEGNITHLSFMINSELQAISDWFAINQLSLNAKKKLKWCYFIIAKEIYLSWFLS